eukprot:symbB.v1.2.007038.t1/scaffold414.1/size398445/2
MYAAVVKTIGHTSSLHFDDVVGWEDSWEDRAAADALQVLISPPKQLNRKAAQRLLRYVKTRTNGIPVNYFKTVLAANRHHLFQDSFDIAIQMLREDCTKPVEAPSDRTAARRFGQEWKSKTVMEATAMVGCFWVVRNNRCDAGFGSGVRFFQAQVQHVRLASTGEVGRSKDKGGAIRALELGSGTGENLVALAQHDFSFVCGVDIVQEAVDISTAALETSCPKALWQVICADLFQLSGEISLLDKGAWQFDFIFDCQCFHCLYQVDGKAAAKIIADLLAPGGHLLMLTGNSEEPFARGPVQLSKDEVLHAFDGTGLVCKDLRSTRFDWTETYRRQDFSEPPLAWCSLWMKEPAMKGLRWKNVLSLLDKAGHFTNLCADHWHEVYLGAAQVCQEFKWPVAMAVLEETVQRHDNHKDSHVKIPQAKVRCAAMAHWSKAFATWRAIKEGDADAKASTFISTISERMDRSGSWSLSLEMISELQRQRVDSAVQSLRNAQMVCSQSSQWASVLALQGLMAEPQVKSPKDLFAGRWSALIEAACRSLRWQEALSMLVGKPLQQGFSNR